MIGVFITCFTNLAVADGPAFRWTGKVDDKKGLFPASYVKLI